MNSFNKQSLLVVLIILLTLKWLIVPAIESQNEEIVKLHTQYNLIKKSQRVIENSSKYLEQLSVLKTAESRLDKILLPAENNNTLYLQQLIEELFKKHDITITSYELSPLNTEQSEYGLISYMSKLNIEGRVEDMIRLQLYVADEMVNPRLIFNNIELRAKNPKGTIVQFQGSMTLSALGRVDNINQEVTDG